MTANLFFFLALITFLGTFFINLTRSAVISMKLHRLADEFELYPKLYIFLAFLQKKIPEESKRALVESLEITSRINRLLFASSIAFYFLMTHLQGLETLTHAVIEHDLIALFGLCLLIILLLLAIDLCATLIGFFAPKITLRFSAPVSSCLLLIFFPIYYLFIVFKGVLRKHENEPRHSPHEFSTTWLKEHLLEILEENELLSLLAPADQKILKLLSSFWEKRVKQVMVPRTKMVMLDATTSVAKASEIFLKEGFSRIPVYREREEIVGVLHYKKLFTFYTQNSSQPALFEKTPISELLSETVFTPEIMRISVLLQELRKKNAHLAVVVDEYGAPVGVVTIEDILEEIVGEIEDELDTELDFQVTRLQDGSWLVHGGMSLQDLDKEGIQIEHDKQDTIGGLIIAHLGHIPKEHHKIEFEDYTFEIVKATDRTIELVRMRLNSN